MGSVVGEQAEKDSTAQESTPKQNNETAGKRLLQQEAEALVAPALRVAVTAGSTVSRAPPAWRHKKTAGGATVGQAVEGRGMDNAIAMQGTSGADRRLEGGASRSGVPAALTGIVALHHIAQQVAQRLLQNSGAAPNGYRKRPFA